MNRKIHMKIQINKKPGRERGFGVVGIIVFLVFIAILVGGFASAFASSQRGWGYPGYNNRYLTGASLFYAGSASLYRNPSIRNSSVNGPGHRGGGLSGGK